MRKNRLRIPTLSDRVGQLNQQITRHMQAWQVSKRSRTGLRFTRNSDEAGIANTLLQIVDIGLLGVIFIAPLFFGGRHDLGRGVFAGIVAVTASAWFLRQVFLEKAVWNNSWANYICLAILAVVTIQLIPLPISWLESIAPRNLEILSLWSGDSEYSVGEWNTISLTPIATKQALAMLVGYLLLFWVSVGRLSTEKDVEKLLKLLAISAVAMSLIGLLHLASSTKLFMGIYNHPYSHADTAAKGSFTCRNHFAHFIILGLGPLCAWIVGLLQKQKQFDRNTNTTLYGLIGLLVLGAIIILLAALMSFSRGGIIVLLVTCSVLVAIYYRAGLINTAYFYSIAIISLVTVGLLSFFDAEQIAVRLSTLSSGSIDKIDREQGRRTIWNANLDSTREGGIFGAGADAHKEIYPVYLKRSVPVEYTHAESGYLQIATQNGWSGVALLIFSILLVFSWCWISLVRANSEHNFLLAGAVTSSLIASITHSVVDFVWFIPACMSITILLLASALRLAQLSTSNKHKYYFQTNSKCVSTLIAGTAIASAVWSFAILVKPASAAINWDRYLIASSDMKTQSTQKLITGAQVQDGLGLEAALEDSIQVLQKVIAINPDSARANMRLAGKYLQLFSQKQQKSDNAMTVDQIRDAAIASNFATAQDLNGWLSKAFKDNYKLLYLSYQHTRRALKLCPLQGEGYLYLSSLCFLEGRPKEAIEHYIQQALLVRPYDGQICFEAGRQLLLLGNGDEAITLWQKVFNDQGKHQLLIIDLLAGQVPASDFIETFRPNSQILSEVWKKYQIRGAEKDWLALIEYGHSILEEEQINEENYQLAVCWGKLGLMHEDINQNNQAVECFMIACRLSPNHYWLHHGLGRTSLKAERFTLAIKHLDWCIARKPADSSLRSELLRAKKLSSQQIAQKKTAPVF